MPGFVFAVAVAVAVAAIAIGGWSYFQRQYLSAETIKLNKQADNTKNELRISLNCDPGFSMQFNITGHTGWAKCISHSASNSQNTNQQQQQNNQQQQWDEFIKTTFFQYIPIAKDALKDVLSPSDVSKFATKVQNFCYAHPIECSTYGISAASVVFAVYQTYYYKVAFDEFTEASLRVDAFVRLLTYSKYLNSQNDGKCTNQRITVSHQLEISEMPACSNSIKKGSPPPTFFAPSDDELQYGEIVQGIIKGLRLVKQENPDSILLRLLIDRLLDQFFPIWFANVKINHIPNNISDFDVLYSQFKNRVKECSSMECFQRPFHSKL